MTEQNNESSSSKDAIKAVIDEMNQIADQQQEELVRNERRKSFWRGWFWACFVILIVHIVIRLLRFE